MRWARGYRAPCRPTRLAEATAAQLGFDYAPEAPFSGRRGRSRLAVVDGLVNADVVRLLVQALAPEERLVIGGTAVDPAAVETLRELRPGSTARKIPQSILREYRDTIRWEQTPMFEMHRDAPESIDKVMS